MNIVDFAWQIIEMKRTIDEQDRELVRLMKVEEEYNQLLNSSLDHSKAMAGNMLNLLMTDGVVEALHAATEKQKRTFSGNGY